MTRRTIVLFTLAMFAALPMIWMSVDSNAGNTLLTLTNGSKTNTALSNYSPSVERTR